MTPEERESILDKHKHIYNGYQALQPNIPNPQPLYVQDYANDKEGITVSNKGDVMSYRNMNINESVEEDKMCECGGMVYEGECTECGKAYKKYDVDIYDVEDLNPKNKFDYVEGKELEEVKVDDLSTDKSYKMKFPSFDGGDDKEEKEVKFKGKVKFKDGKPMYQFVSKDDISGAMLGADDDDDISDIYPLDELESNYDFKAPAYQFKSDGPADAYDEDDKNDFSYGRAFSDMGDSDDWTDERILMSLRRDTAPKKAPGTDTSIDMDLDDVKEPYNFYSGGPGKSIGVYEEDDLDEGYLDWDLEDEFEVKKDTDLPKGHDKLKKGDKVKLVKKWKNANPGKHGDIFGTDKSEDDYGLSRDDIQYLSTDIEEMVDEDLKESFTKQKNKITEMFDRMKKY